MSTGKRILITGATGYIGQALVPALVERGHTLALVVRNVAKAEALGLSALANAVFEIESENDKWSDVAAWQPEVLIHLASTLTSGHTETDIANLTQANITFGAHMLAALKDAGLKLVINTGTFAEYFWGDGKLVPAYYYAATKTAFRSILQFFAGISHYNYVTVVPYTVYGGHQPQKKIIDLLLDSLVATEPIKLSPGEQMLDFVHLSDVVEFYCRLAEANAADVATTDTLYCGTGVGTSVRHLANIIEQVSGKKTNVAWGALPYRPLDTMHAVAPIAPALKLLDWRAQVSLAEGVSKRINNQ